MNNTEDIEMTQQITLYDNIPSKAMEYLTKTQIMAIPKFFTSQSLTFRKKSTTSFLLDQHNSLLHSTSPLYPQVSVAIMPYQRSFSLQQMKIIHKKTQLDTMQKTTDHGKLNPYVNIYIAGPTSTVQGTYQKRG